MESKVLKWTRSKRSFKAIPRDFHELFTKGNLNGASKLRICIFCNPCGGNGDVVFAIKLYTYLKAWYRCSITIVTTRPKTFLKNHIIPDTRILCVKEPGLRADDCLETKVLKIYDRQCKKQVKVKPFDLFLVAPWVSEELFKYDSLKGLFPESNPFNTYIFSAYNQDANEFVQLFDFATGIGKSRVGLMLMDRKVKKPTKLLRKISGPYVMSYISKSDIISKSAPIECLKAFIKIMIKKYPDGITIIVPKFIEKELVFVKSLTHFGVSITLVTEKKTHEFGSDDDPLFTLRADILPVSMDLFHGLLKYSEPDMLLTGNQSVTDLLSIRDDVTLYYQLMPWESSFSKELKKLIKIPWLSSAKNSCGSTAKASPSYKQVKKHDFRKLAKPKLDAIIRMSVHVKKESWLQDYIEFYGMSRKKTTFINRLKN